MLRRIGGQARRLPRIVKGHSAIGGQRSAGDGIGAETTTDGQASPDIGPDLEG
jgi:hypothetical protein